MSDMASFAQFDWTSGGRDDHLEMARAADETGLRQIARDYDWSLYPEPVLGWVMAQKCIDLGSALTAFLNGAPERFNYVPKRDVPAGLQGAALVLDNICLRVNSGFYLVWPDKDVTQRDRIEHWLARQAQDRVSGRHGRWVLDEEIVGALLRNALQMDPARETAVYSEHSSLLRDLFSPVLELGVSRRVLRYLPDEHRVGGKAPPDDLSKLEF
jgi:hypothetical protein